MAYSISFAASMAKPLIIIQARLSSTRLPGKVLRPFVGDKTILDVQLETIKKCLPNHELVVATTTNPVDDALVAHSEERGVAVFRGSEQDVLQRFIDCAHQFGADKLIRVCSDNPFLAGEELAELTNGSFDGWDYVSYKNHIGTPAIKTHWGLFAEYVTTLALEKAAKQTKDAFYREHVTNYVYGHQDAFQVKLLNAPEEIYKRDDLRFTIDTQADFKTCQEIYKGWDKQSLTSLISLVDANATWLKGMKAGIEQFIK